MKVAVFVASSVPAQWRRFSCAASDFCRGKRTQIGLPANAIVPAEHGGVTFAMFVASIRSAGPIRWTSARFVLCSGGVLK